MKTKILAATIVFAALTVALNPAISGIGIPAPYAPYLIYGLWEIPIVAAFLLISATSGVAISLVNATVLFALFPGSLPAGPFYNLIAIFSMLLGIYLARRFTKPESKQQQKAILKIAAASTILGVILRVAIMTLVNYITLQQPYPIGFELDEIAVVATLPLTAIFNGTTVLYTIPIGEFVARVIKSRLKIES
jgi:riboflavin transporter FmnP